MLDFKKINNKAFQYYPALRKINEYVLENYSEDIPLKTAANVAGMERKYFSTFFHTKVGMCFCNWLMQIRIFKAAALFGAEDYSITDVAFRCGYQDLRTFERAFKKCTGHTPREFKKIAKLHNGIK